MTCSASILVLLKSVPLYSLVISPLINFNKLDFQTDVVLVIFKDVGAHPQGVMK